jgi:hypothetical protein
MTRQSASDSCCRRSRRSRKSPWRALPMAVLAALTPKCPACLAAWFAAAGLAGLGDVTATYVDSALMWGACVVSLGGTVAWFVVRRGPAGGAAAAFGATMIGAGRLIPGGHLLGIAGVTVLGLYLVCDQLVRTRLANHRRRLAPERTS